MNAKIDSAKIIDRKNIGMYRIINLPETGYQPGYQPDSVFKIRSDPDTRFRIPDTGYQIPDSHYKFL